MIPTPHPPPKKKLIKTDFQACSQEPDSETHQNTDTGASTN